MTSLDPAALLAEDDAARARALDVDQSFLVQAPAGSGKTELLIQRYLALLARVDEPEHVVALTFTRKAAGEMRERVLKALADAREGQPVDRPHARRTRALAQAVLEQDARRHWSITENASRLGIQTFDALASGIARRAPLAAGLGPRPSYLDDASPLYRAAAEAAINAAASDDLHWRRFLAHVDNQGGRATELIADLLAQRDQWLRLVTGTPLDELRESLERALRDEIAGVLEATRAAFPASSGAAIAACAVAAAGTLAAGDDTRELAEALQALATAGGLPAADVAALPHWQTLAHFLMVRPRTHFKRKVDKNDGFPAVGRPPGAEERRARKAAMESLCESLNDLPGLAGALAAVSRLPAPGISEAAWSIVEALLHVLHQAAARLLLVFAAERKVDFVQGSIAALEALGSGDEPSDLLLRLDTRVQHVLVDEFQDTSFMQLRLLERLTGGWQPGDGRTIFAVGDPMQSIYRFREAEVGHFLQAQQSGSIASLPVERLRLRRNFRSQPNLVGWVNRVFPEVLGLVSDARRSVVSFEAAVSARNESGGSEPTLDVCGTPEEEAAAVVSRVREAQRQGAQEIAILVRARAHLATILPALRRAHITFAAVELDRLSQRQSVLDLEALTHALLQPADRTAWLAVLRAPWCGLDLHDLCCIAEAADAARAPSLLSLFEGLGTVPSPLSTALPSPSGVLPSPSGRRVGDEGSFPHLVDTLSADGRNRLTRTLETLRPALASRGRATVHSRVRGAWLALGGPASLDDPLDLEAATRYLELLAEHEAAGDVPDRDALRNALDTLYASSAPSFCDVQVMTMHKAKGLEFDTVIVPGLARGGSRNDAPLLRWKRRDAGLLIAPGKARGGDPEPLHAWLASLERETGDAELGRLLYVACTRAKQRLHLIATPGVKMDAKREELCWKDPLKGSSLAKLWPALTRDMELPEPQGTADAPEALPPPNLERLPWGYRVPVPDTDLPVRAGRGERDLSVPPFDWVRETTRRIGTLAHRLLARIADDGIDAWTSERVDAFAARVESDLLSVGFAPDELPAAREKVLLAVRRTLADARGRWLFDARHEEARSEWALTGIDEGGIVRVVVDRSFVADGERWIVDFKTGSHEGGEVEAFLDSEVERYREQLLRYGRLMRGLDARPVRLALYYPLVDGGFREIRSVGSGLGVSET